MCFPHFELVLLDELLCFPYIENTKVTPVSPTENVENTKPILLGDWSEGTVHRVQGEQIGNEKGK